MKIFTRVDPDPKPLPWKPPPALIHFAPKTTTGALDPIKRAAAAIDGLGGLALAFGDVDPQAVADARREQLDRDAIEAEKATLRRIIGFLSAYDQRL